MLKTLFAILFALMLLCACNVEEPETPVVPEEEEKEEEIVTSADENLEGKENPKIEEAWAKEIYESGDHESYISRINQRIESYKNETFEEMPNHHPAYPEDFPTVKNLPEANEKNVLLGWKNTEQLSENSWADGYVKYVYIIDENHAIILEPSVLIIEEEAILAFVNTGYLNQNVESWSKEYFDGFFGGSFGSEEAEISETEPENKEVLEENEPEIITEIVDYIPECVRIHASGLTEKDEPKPEDIIGIGTVEIKKLSGKQKEIIIPLLQEESWIERDFYEGNGREASVAFLAENGGLILIIYDEDKTAIVKKWGENEEFRKYYEAPKEVFEDISAFYEKLYESMELTNKWPLTSEELMPEYEKYIKRSRFALNLDENYSKDNYFVDNNAEHMFNFAYELAEDAGIVGEDTYYPDYPAELVEKLISTYFLWDEETVKNHVKRNQPQEGFYRFDGEYGSAAIAPVLTKTEKTENGIDFYLDIYCYEEETMDRYWIEQSSILSIEFSEDGTWKYVSNKIYFYRYFPGH